MGCKISRKNSISHKISQYSTSATNRIQGTTNRIKLKNTEKQTKHRKTTEYTETTKHENKEKATAGN
jgi:CRISPR/Cas system-associated protein Csx1